MAAEFKIGRLRYNWAGTWAPSTVYSRDDVVLHDGKTYTCLVPNTSSLNFNTDLNATFPCWLLVIDGKTWIGIWTTGHSYSLGNIVVFGGKAYYCATAHTSTTFLADAANWTEYTEFDGWKPEWTINTAYGVNDVVKYGGIVYKCTANHLSAGSTGAGLEADQASWTVYYSGVEYKGAWANGTRYKLNDLVKVDGNIYRCSTYNSDSSFTPTKWTMWLPGQMFDLVWSSGTTYQIGDTVVYGGDAYISKTANNSNNFPDTDTTNWGLFNVGYSVRNTWDSGATYAPGDLVSRNGVLYEATVNSTAQDPNTSTTSTVYVPAGSSSNTLNIFSSNNISPGMIVSSTGTISGQTVSTVTVSTALSTSATLSGTAITVSSFTSTTLSSPGQYAVVFAIPTQSSAPATAVQYKITGNSNTAFNGTFTCTASSTTSITLTYGVDPGSYGTGTTKVTAVNGTVLTLAGTVTGTFSAGMVISGPGVSPAYIVSGSGTSWVVSTSQGVSSVAITGTKNSITLSKASDSTIADGQTISFFGLNSAYWSLLIPGKKWANRWATAISYSVGDIVSWANGTYVCINKHTSTYINSTTNNRPDYDNTSINWILLIAHDLNNTLNVQGDLRTFNNGKPVSLPITSTTGEIDTYILGVSTDLPNWRKLNVVPAVYYVDAFSGIDSLQYGVTWDQPWRTISYACNVINQGFYYPNAVALLKANKAFMVAEMYQWMLYQMSQSISPFSPDSLWDVNYTQRDADRIIDAVIYDMKRGGNSQTVAATLSYFFVGTKNQFINSLVASSAVYYSPALTFLLSVMQAVVRNASLSSYQTLNAVPANSVVDQVINNSLIAETNTDQRFQV